MKIIGSEDIAIASVQFDSRLVHPGDLFVAVKGTKSDGHRFIDKAIESGAVAILCEHLPEKLNKKTTWVQTTGSARALGISASAFYGNPSAGLGVIGVTGTNGKTTIASLLYEFFQKLG